MALLNKKTTFMLIGSNNKKLSSIEDTLKEKEILNITRTDLINICISEFLSNINTPEDISPYLIKYNKI